MVNAVASWGVFGSVYLGIVREFIHTGATYNPITSSVFMDQARQAQDTSFLLSVVGALVNCVVYCAVVRSVIHPEKRRFAYLRIGAPELFAMVLVVAGDIALIVALFLPLVIIGVVVAGLVAAHANVAGVVTGILGGRVLAACLAYVLLRFSLIVPMMVSDGKFHYADAWRLTKRHAAALLVITIAIGLVVLAPGVGHLSSVARALSHLETFFGRPPVEIMTRASPLLLILGVMSIPLTGCTFAIIGATWARTYRDMSGPDLAATFS